MKRETPAITADMLVFTSYRNKTEILLIERKYDPFKGCWALPGGFVLPGETFLQAAKRELEEETSLSELPLSPVGVFDKVDRDPRGRTITMAYWTVIMDRSKAEAGSDAAFAKWFPVDELPPIAFDHADIIHATIEHLKALYRSSLPLFQTAPGLKVETLKKLLEYINEHVKG